MFSTTSEYALRSLAHLASQPKGTSILGRDLAEQCRIPANYLSKILVVLRNAGVIHAARGSSGGYQLGRNPQKIRLIEIVELFDGARSRPECLLGINQKCSDTRPCSAHGAWRDVRNAYVQFLETTTVATLAEDSVRAETSAVQGSKPAYAFSRSTR